MIREGTVREGTVPLSLGTVPNTLGTVPAKTMNCEKVIPCQWGQSLHLGTATRLKQQVVSRMLVFSIFDFHLIPALCSPTGYAIIPTLFGIELRGHAG